jgi:hypothetical protein
MRADQQLHLGGGNDERAPNRAAKQHVQDKAIRDHLTVGRRRPRQVPVDPRRASRFDEENGRELMETLKKRWTGAKSVGRAS